MPTLARISHAGQNPCCTYPVFAGSPDFLTRYADSKRRRFEALDALDAVAAGTASRGETRWSRDELHERPDRASSSAAPGRTRAD